MDCPFVTLIVYFKRPCFDGNRAIFYHNMNKISTLLMVAAILLIACKNSKESEIPPEVTLDVSASEWTVAPQKDTILLDIKSNSRWQILQGSNWCQVTPNNGMGDATVQIIVESNTFDQSSTERTANLMLVAGNGSYSKDTTLRIKQQEPNFTVSINDVLKASSEGETLSFDIKTNLTWIIESEGDWFTVVPSKGTGDAKVQVVVQSNDSYNSRGAGLGFRTIPEYYIIGYGNITQTGKSWNVKMAVEVTENPEIRNQVFKIDMSGRNDGISGMVVDWGDGVVDEFRGLAHALSHTYANQNSIYSINIQGTENVPVSLEMPVSSIFNTRITSLYIDNKELAVLKCDDHSITSLDVSKCSQLQTLSCKGNQLTALDVSQNPQLKYLYCGGNILTSINVNNNTLLQMLSCYGNKLTPEAMNRIYQDLPKVYKDDPQYGNATIEVDRVNAGDYSIAENKGWKVILR